MHYDTFLREKQYIDYEDMILTARRVLQENPTLTMHIAESYQCILIDEFQDTNDAQMSLIQEIIAVNPDEANVFAVGDDDQSIYKFQGANTKNIRDFIEYFSETQLVILLLKIEIFMSLTHRAENLKNAPI